MTTKAYGVRMYTNTIREYDADKFTEKTVTIEGRRHNMISDFERFFHNREEAVEFVRERLERSIRFNRKALEEAIAALEVLK